MKKPSLTTFAAIQNEVIQWGRDRQIIQNSTAYAQSIKTQEEFRELTDHLAQLDSLKRFLYPLDIETYFNTKASLMEEIKDDLGDILVTLVMVSSILDIDLVESFGLAYDEIKDRKGYLNKDGLFIKEK